MLPRLQDTISASGGWISFARYMELVLYDPGLGYYAGRARKFGAEGVFVTAPELGSLFGRCHADMLARPEPPYSPSSSAASPGRR